MNDVMFKLVPFPEDDSPESLIQRTTDGTYFCAEPLPNRWAEIVVEFCNAAYGEGRHDAEKDIWANAHAIASAEAAGMCPMPQPTVYTVGRWRETQWGMSHGPFHEEQLAINVVGDEGDCILRIGMDGKETILWKWNNTKLVWETPSLRGR